MLHASKVQHLFFLSFFLLFLLLLFVFVAKPKKPKTREKGLKTRLNADFEINC